MLSIGQNVMLERVVAYIKRHQLLPEEGEIIVAVSGGTDSLCLLHLLLQICGPGKHYTGVSLHAAHLDHMLRGKVSADEARAVAHMLEDWNVPFTIGQIDVAELAKAEKCSLEEAARSARYRFLREIARGKSIAVAHHADDQVETLILHWLRGSGLNGMVGMLPRQQDIIRPLLAITRAETSAYCQAQGITPMEDLSNNDPRFLRNRIRHEVIPLLRNLNPGIQRTLLRNAEAIQIDLDWLESQVDICWENVILSTQAEAIKLDTHALLALPQSLQRHLLRRVTARLCAGQSPLEPRHFLLIERLLTERADRQERSLDLPQRLRVVQQSAVLTIEHSPTLRPGDSKTTRLSENLPLSLAIPGEVAIPGTQWLIRTEILSEDLTARVGEALKLEDWPTVWQLLGPRSPLTVYIDGERTGTHLLARTRLAGDRIQPLGMEVEKRVQDIFVDQRVPRGTRATTPLIFSETHCLWVTGICLDHRIRLTNKTRHIVCITALENVVVNHTSGEDSARTKV